MRTIIYNLQYYNTPIVLTLSRNTHTQQATNQEEINVYRVYVACCTITINADGMYNSQYQIRSKKSKNKNQSILKGDSSIYSLKILSNWCKHRTPIESEKNNSAIATRACLIYIELRDFSTYRVCPYPRYSINISPIIQLQ